MSSHAGISATNGLLDTGWETTRNQTKGLYASILPSVSPATRVSFDWTCGNAHGVLKSDSGQSAPFTTSSSYVAFYAGDSPGSDTASVTAYRELTGGKRIPIGTATRTIQVRDPNASVRKLSYIASDWTLVSTTRPYRWHAALGVWAVWKLDPNASGYLIYETVNGVELPPYYKPVSALLRADAIPGCRDDEGGIMCGGAARSWEQDIYDPDPVKPPWTGWTDDDMRIFNEGMAKQIRVVAQ